MLAIYFKEFRDHFGIRTDDSRHRPPDPWFTDSSSSASSTPTDDGPFLQCALCRDRYNRPKVLPCLHTFCEGCLITHTPKDSLTLTCPICRHQSILPKNGVLGLQDNVIVSSITGVLETRKEKKHCNNVSKSYSNNESFKYHRNDEKLKELPPIEENFKEQKNHLKTLLCRATSHIPVLKEDIHSIAIVVETLNQNHHQAKSDMFQCLEDLENTLKDKKTQLVDELDRIHKEKYDVLQQQKHLLEMCLSSLEEHCHSAEQILTDGSDEELAIVYCEMAEKLEDFVETDLQKTPVENDFVVYDQADAIEVRGKLKCLNGVRTCNASPCESILEADLSKTFEIGDTLTWILAVRDSKGLSTDVDPLILTTDLRTPDNSQITPEVINKNGGNYVINFIAACKGVYGLAVKFHGQHVRGSPYLLTCSSKQQSDGNSAKLHRQNITESLYLAANKAKELRDSSLIRNMHNNIEQVNTDDKASKIYEALPDKHYKQQKNNKYVNDEDADHNRQYRTSADIEHVEAIENNDINILDTEPTRICGSHIAGSPRTSTTYLNHEISYDKQTPEKQCSSIHKAKDVVDLSSSRFHSNRQPIGGPHLSRAQSLKTAADRSHSHQSFENSHSPTRKIKGIAESPPPTFHGQNIIGSPRSTRSHPTHSLSIDKPYGKQSVENIHSSASKNKNHMVEASVGITQSPPSNRAQKIHEMVTNTFHGQQIHENIHSPTCRRRELSSPKLRRNNSLRNSMTHRDQYNNSHGQQILENSHSPTCRRKEIEVSSPKLYRQHSVRNSNSGRSHQTDSHHRCEQHTPSPTRKYKETPDTTTAKPCGYHSVGSPRSNRARLNYEIIDHPRGEETFKTSHSPSCKRREIPSPNLPRHCSIDSMCTGRANQGRDTSPDKFIGRNLLENTYSSYNTQNEKISSKEHRIGSPHSNRTIETFNKASRGRDIGNELDSNYRSTETHASQPEKDEHHIFDKPCDSTYRNIPEDHVVLDPNGCKNDATQEEHKDNISLSSSCEAIFGPVDNDLLIKIGRRGSKKGEFINLQGVCCTADDKIVVADSNNQCVQVFDNEGNFLLRFGSRGRGPGQMQRPTGVAVTPAGNYLVADYENRWVNVFKPDGEYCKRFGSKKLLGPRGLTVTRDGNIIVVDNKASCLYIMQDNGKVLGKIGTPGCGKGRFSGPHYVALDTADRLVITDFHNHQVHIFLLDGTHAVTFGSNGEGNGQFNAPTGVAVDSQDNIIVADWGNNRLQVFDSNGSFLSFINTATEPVFGPQDLALTNDGHVVVADSGNHCLKIYKYLQ